jgi:uncharacterized protein (UPF0303 family)
MLTEQNHAALRLDGLAAEEAELVFESFDNDTAWRLGCRLVEAARAAGLPVAIGIRRGSQQLFHAALPGTCADNDAWLARKARVVERFARSSFGVGTHCLASGRSFEETYRLDPVTYAAHGGAFPVTVRAVGVVGSVGVSGLPQSDDHAFVVEQLRAFLAAEFRAAEARAAEARASQFGDPGASGHR